MLGTGAYLQRRCLPLRLAVPASPCVHRGSMRHGPAKEDTMTLIRFALRSARDRGLQVIPICPFFAAYIQRHTEEQDLLDPSYRKVLGLA